MESHIQISLLTLLVTSVLLVSCSELNKKISPSQEPELCRPSGNAAASESLSGSYIVAFKTEPGLAISGFSGFTAESRAHYRYLDQSFLPDATVSSIQFITSLDLSVQSLSGNPGIFSRSLFRAPYSLNEERAAAIARVDFRSAELARETLATWEKNGDIWFYEPNYISKLSNQISGTENVFGDLKTKYESLNYWWLDTLNVVQAYESLAARDQANPAFRSDENILGSKPIVAVLDSGVDYEHPALKDRIWTNSDINASSCTNDLHGCDTTAATKGKLGNGNVYPFDTNGPGESCFNKSPNCSHGTHVAGIIAGDYEWADPELNRRAAGVCPVCQIMVLKIVGKVGKESGILDSSILSAFKYVSLFRREGSPAVRIINASFGKFVRSRSVGLLVRLLKDRHGAIVIGASGNEDSMSMEYPAAFNDAIAVSAVDQNLEKVDFSNFGRWVDISAPGDGILSTVPGESLDIKSGTSMAAPMVSGVAGLLLAQKQDVSYGDLRSALLNGAEPSMYNQSHGDGLNFACYFPKIPGEQLRQPLLGYGMLNARNSINNVNIPGQPIFSSLNRVKPGCSSIPGAGSRNGARHVFGLIILAMPLLIGIARKKKYAL